MGLSQVVNLSCKTLDFLGLEDLIWISIFSAATDLKSLFSGLRLLNLSLEPSLEAKLWDLDVELVHDQLHEVINFSVNNQSGHVIIRSLLEVDNDNLSSSSGSLSDHIASWVNSKRRTEAKHDIGARSVIVAILKDLRIEILAKVDDGILKITATSLIIAFSASLVVFRSVSYSEVSHVSSLAFFANF